jgi:hypothetical protein
MKTNDLIDWLLEGDVSIQYQVHRDLLNKNRLDLQQKIAKEGWGKEFLSKQRPDGHWGHKFYHPKWTSTHYTLLDLRNLCISPEISQIRNVIQKIAMFEKGHDGGINPAGSTRNSDVCINGMFLNYAAYFKTDEGLLKPVVDFILSQKMKDGGFNCCLNRSGAKHSSLHTTISVMEGITEYAFNGYSYRLDELKECEKTAKEFILIHQLFLSDHTGKVIHPVFLRMPYPYRWRYDFLRALDYFQYSKTLFDDRMKPAIDHLLEKRNQHLSWNVNAKYPGQEHFEMEKAGKPSRWNTLRALRILKYYNFED